MIAKVLLSLILAILGAISFFIYYFVLSYNFDRDLAKQEVIANAYLNYCRIYAKYPSSLEDLVNAKLLPAESDLFKEPPSIFKTREAYDKSCYDVFKPSFNADINFTNYLGRSIVENGVQTWVFSPIVNAKIRDELIPLKMYPPNVAP